MSLALDTIRDGLPQTPPAAATVLPSYPGTPGNHSGSGTSADMKVTETFVKDYACAAFSQSPRKRSMLHMF